MQLRNEDIIYDVEIYQPRRRGGKLQFVLLHITDDAMASMASADYVELPDSVEIPADAEVAFRNVTGDEYAPSTDEHWGFHVRNNRITLIVHNAIL